MQASPTEAAGFDHGFRRGLRHLRRRSALHAAAGLVPWLELGLLCLLLLARSGQAAFSSPPALFGLVAILAAGVGWRLWRTPAGRNAALLLDRHLETRELVTAAHETVAGVHHPFARVARAKAAAVLAGPAVSEALPLTGLKSWRPAILGLVALALAGLVPFPEPEAHAARSVDPQVEAAAETLARELEPLAALAAEIDRPAAQDALRKLEDLAEEMRQGELETVDDALVALTRLEETLGVLHDEAPVNGFDDLLKDMAAEPFSSELARAMSDADREALRETLRRLGEALTAPDAQTAALERQLERFEQRLEELAALLEEAGEREAAAAVRELLDALARGDLEQARQLLEAAEIGGACRLGGELAAGERLAAELGELLALGRYLLGQSPPPRLGSGTRGARRPGDGAGPHPGTSSTNEEGRGYETGEPLLRDRRSTASADREGTFEALYDSRLSRGEGDDLRLLGQVGAEGEMLSEAGRGLGSRGEGTLPLRPFAPPAAGSPERAMDLESVPLGYRELVHRYFQRNATPPVSGAEAEGDEP